MRWACSRSPRGNSAATFRGDLVPIGRAASCRRRRFRRDAASGTRTPVFTDRARAVLGVLEASVFSRG